jgi:DNA-binding MarR family transcriptional regulator
MAGAPVSASREATTDEIDPLIHVPARLRIVVSLAALPAGDALSFTRLQAMIGLTAGNLLTHLRKLEEAGYLTSEKTGNGTASRTSVALTNRGRAALEAYTENLRALLGQALDPDRGRPHGTPK